MVLLPALILFLFVRSTLQPAVFSMGKQFLTDNPWMLFLTPLRLMAALVLLKNELATTGY
jgi:hypothetical protein